MRIVWIRLTRHRFFMEDLLLDIYRLLFIGMGAFGGRKGFQRNKIRTCQIEDEVIAVPQPYDLNSNQSALVSVCDVVGASRKSESRPDGFVACPAHPGSVGLPLFILWSVFGAFLRHGYLPFFWGTCVLDSRIQCIV